LKQISGGSFYDIDYQLLRAFNQTNVWEKISIQIDITESFINAKAS